MRGAAVEAAGRAVVELAGGLVSARAGAAMEVSHPDS
jgi:hypothetical protein